jgi:O-antigen ligase
MLVSAINSTKTSLHDNRDMDFNEGQIGRKSLEDPTSGRLILVEQGFELFWKFPIIGIGKANIAEYGDKYLKNGLIYPDLHNGYLTILVAYGTTGFSLFFCFAIKVLIEISRFLFITYKKPQCRCFENLFAVIIAFGCYSLFELTMPVEFNFITNFFWLFLGYTVANAEIYHNRLIKKKLRQNLDLPID